MKIIVAGVGKIGSTLAKQLSAEGHDLTLIDNNRNSLASCTDHYDVLGICGNCCVKNILVEAGAERADLLIAVTGSDEINMLCCMIAHFIKPDIPVIARIRNPEYINQTYEMRDAFGLSMSVNPEKQTANEIAHMIKYPGFLKLDTFAKGRAEIVELKISSDSKLCNVTLSNINSVIKCKVLICVILRDGKVLMPTGDTKLLDGDRIFVTAPAENLSILLANLGITTHKAKKVVICGGGKISYYLADILHKSNISVTIIEQDKDRCITLANALPYANIINSDASNQMNLEDENISDYNTMVALTGMDELNILIALYGNSFKIPQIITKLGKMSNIQINDILPIGSTVSPKDLCCSRIVKFVRSIQYKTGAAIAVHFIADSKAEAIEFRVDETTLNRGKPLKNIKFNKNILLCCITHNGIIEIPDGNSSFDLGDTVIIVANSDNSVNKLNDIFAG